jgi:hypothetical protein
MAGRHQREMDLSSGGVSESQIPVFWLRAQAEKQVRIFLDANILFSAADNSSATRMLFDAARRSALLIPTPKPSIYDRKSHDIFII